MSNCCCLEVEAVEDPCTPVTASQMDALVFVYGKNSSNCPRYQAVSQLINSCAIGSLASPGTVENVVGLDSHRCLVYESPSSFVRRLETDWAGTSPSHTIVIGNLSPNNGHTPTLDVKVSPSVGNLLTILPDGLFVQAPAETPFSAVDSTSINFSTSGTLNHTLTGSVVVSPSGGNQLQSTPQGLYVPPVIETPVSVTDTNSIDLVASGTSNHSLQANVKVSACAGNLILINGDGLCVQQTPLTVTDTSSVNLTSSGTSGHDLQASVKVSASAGNQLVINGDGLFVPAPVAFTETPLTVVDTSTVDLTSSGISGHTLQAAVKVSSCLGNVLTIQSDGLCVPASSPLVQNTLSVGLTLNPDGRTISADVILSPDPGNTLVLHPNGLYVPTPASFTETPLTVNDSSSIDFSSSGVSNHTLTGSVKVSSTPENDVSILPDGLFVPTVYPLEVLAAPVSGSGTYNAATIGSWGLGSQIVGSGTLTYTNTHNQNVRILAWLRAPNTTFNAGPGNYWTSGIGPNTNPQNSNVGFSSRGNELAISWASSHLLVGNSVVAPGASYSMTIEREVIITQFTNSGFEAITLGFSNLMFLIVPA